MIETEIGERGISFALRESELRKRELKSRRTAPRFAHYLPKMTVIDLDANEPLDRERLMKRPETRWCFLAVYLFLVGSVHAAQAACSLEGSSLSTSMVDSLKQKPLTMIGGNEIGTKADYELSLLVGKFALTGSDAIRAIKSILPKATVKQRSAIGNGLHRAFSTCHEQDPTATARITAALPSMGDRTVFEAYELADRLGDDAAFVATSQPDLPQVEGTSGAGASPQVPVTPQGLDLSDPSAPLTLTDPFAPP